MSAAPDERPDARLEELRAEIAAADRAILDAVNRRLELVRRVRRHKREQGLPFVDPGQEQRLLSALAAQNAGPLSQVGLRQLFLVVLGLTKREVARAELAALPERPGS